MPAHAAIETAGQSGDHWSPLFKHRAVHGVHCTLTLISLGLAVNADHACSRWPTHDRQGTKHGDMELLTRHSSLSRRRATGAGTWTP